MAPLHADPRFLEYFTNHFAQAHFGGSHARWRGSRRSLGHMLAASLMLTLAYPLSSPHPSRTTCTYLFAHDIYLLYCCNLYAYGDLVPQISNAHWPLPVLADQRLENNVMNRKYICLGMIALC